MHNLVISRVVALHTHACEARPLTTVRRTSLSVIVVVIVIDVKNYSAHMKADKWLSRHDTLLIEV